MCARFTLRTPAHVLIQHFGLNGELQLPLRYNIAPTQDVAVIRQTDAGRELSRMRWGLVPSWADDPKIGYKMINARSEGRGGIDSPKEQRNPRDVGSREAERACVIVCGSRGTVLGN